MWQRAADYRVCDGNQLISQFVCLLKNIFLKKIYFKKVNYFLIFDNVMRNKLENTF
jgi:hypothetical protein